MNEFIEAQKILHNTLFDIHHSVAILAFNAVGVEVSDWDELTGRVDEAEALLSEENSIFTDVDYDGGHLIDRGQKPHYPVILDHNNSITLNESGTPTHLFEKHRPDTTYVAAGIEEIDHAAKYISLHLNTQGKKIEPAYVLLNRDMPATLIYQSDANHVGALIDHEGISALAKIEAAFGPEAAITLSSESCIGLAGALRAAHATFSAIPGKR